MDCWISPEKKPGIKTIAFSLIPGFLWMKSYTEQRRPEKPKRSHLGGFLTHT